MTVLPTEVFSAAQVRAMDARAIRQGPRDGYGLMCAAAAGALQALQVTWPAARRVLLCCGGGNNGGDGYVLARLALAQGFEVTVVALADPARLGGDARRAYADFSGVGGIVQAFEPGLPLAADVVVDALFGTGLDRPVEGQFLSCIEAINTAAVPVLALDIPSGLHADTGTVLGKAVVADVTVTFVALKSGLFLGEAVDHVGSVVLDTLGIAPSAEDGPACLRRLDDAEGRQWLRPRRRSAHKGDHGRVLLVGGGPGMPGAIRLAAEAALRVGAGLVVVATRPEHVSAVVAGRPEIICHGVEDAAGLSPLLEACDVLAVGPGLGRDGWAYALWRAALECPVRTVMDADALNFLAAEPRRRDDWVLTPHPGEAARLMAVPTGRIQADRLAAVRDLQSRFGGACVLKGAGSLVLCSEGSVGLCDAGNPGMAVAGMGDVLTGIIAGLLAQGLPLGVAARVGTRLHARVGDAEARRGERGLLASDLIAGLRPWVNPS
ncbi:MAG: NAD(P)H-hydrate dehydratase [Steroidobacteraceae bacterium]